MEFLIKCNSAIRVFLHKLVLELLTNNANDEQTSVFLQIESLSVTFHGHDLIVDSELELNYGRFVNLDLTITLVMQGAIFLLPAII